MAMSLAQREDRAMERGAALVGQIERVADQVWAVPSTSYPGEIHVVALVEAVLHCTCPAGEAGQPCRHAAGVRLWIRAHARRRAA
jgi:hypothetical protein